MPTAWGQSWGGGFGVAGHQAQLPDSPASSQGCCVAAGCLGQSPGKGGRQDGGSAMGRRSMEGTPRVLSPGVPAGPAHRHLWVLPRGRRREGGPFPFSGQGLALPGSSCGWQSRDGGRGGGGERLESRGLRDLGQEVSRYRDEGQGGGARAGRVCPGWHLSWPRKAGAREAARNPRHGARPRLGAPAPGPWTSQGEAGRGPRRPRPADPSLRSK